MFELTIEQTAPTLKIVLLFYKKGLRLQRKTQNPQRRDLTENGLYYIHTCEKNKKCLNKIPPNG